MKRNRFRDVLASGRVPVGHMIMEFGTRGIAHILASTDLDFVVYDMEHSGIDLERIFDLVAWAKAADFSPFVRVPQPQYHFLARVMDSGALGVMIGNVETAEQAREIVRAVKYAPIGKRGVGLGTAHTDYVMPDPVAYFQESNTSSVVICQIESPIGIANSAAIAATPGVDILWVGHFDLSTAMGIPGEFHNPAFLDALNTVVSSAKSNGKRLGIQPGSMQQLDEWLALGFDVISYQADIGLYRSALQSAVNEVRERSKVQAGLSRGA